ncbi:F-box-like domain-containing protein [Microdochium nivale]|nr:F-box-like domain-containing protein [Microdochium nivale]
MLHHNRNGTRTLPNEILVKIFDFFTTHVGLEERLHLDAEADSTPDYHTLSRITSTSRHFNRLALPVLYRVVFLHERTSCALLFRTLLERPGVGQLVKSLSIHAYDDEFDPETDEILRQHLQILHGKEADSGAMYPLPRSADAQIAVFLACLPQIEALDVMLDDKQGLSSDFVTILPYWRGILSNYQNPKQRSSAEKNDKLISSTKVIQDHFSMLRQVRLRHWRLLNKIPRLQYATELLSLPTLKWIHCHWTNLSLAPEQISRSKLGPPIVLALKDIYLENSSIDGESLECILSSCTGISSLVVSWSEEQACDFKLNYREVGAILREHCSGTLETLVLNPVKARPVHETAAGDEAGSIGPLGGLSVLRRLAIDSNALLGHGQYFGVGSRDSSDKGGLLQDLLPASLEVLHLSFPIGAVKTGEKALYQLLDSSSSSSSGGAGTVTAMMPRLLRQVSVDDRNVRFRKDFEALGWTRVGLREVGAEMPYHSGCFYPMLTRNADLGAEQPVDAKT